MNNTENDRSVHRDESVEFFNSIAAKWDSWENMPELRLKFLRGFAEFNVQPFEHILDIGCGTGNLAIPLLEVLSGDGRVFALDVSEQMLEVACGKCNDSRVNWLLADAGALPFRDSSLDRVFCCSVWPHLDDTVATSEEIRRILRKNGIMHVWHLLPRSKINEIHAEAGEAVRKDILRPASDTASLLERVGFEKLATVDSDDRYLVTARKI